ncbi:MAG TPA: hypothetical protein VK960_02480 [Acidimicrobiia bacterium]|nr:hypothetical protein [Acidimicrobiia bacterium]
MDIAVNLAETYLRLNGYLTLSEFEVQERRADGTFRAVTDIDIMAIRFPGEIYAADPHEGPDTRLLLLADSELRLEPDQIDVIVGEVKQAEAEFNPGIRSHKVLHQMLRRIEWLFDGDLRQVVDDLASRDACVAPARGGGEIRVRLVAFGRAPKCDLNTMTHSHMVSTLLRFFSGTDMAFRPVQFRDPAPAMLSLLLKSGFDVSRELMPPEEEAAGD